MEERQSNYTRIIGVTIFFWERIHSSSVVLDIFSLALWKVTPVNQKTRVTIRPIVVLDCCFGYTEEKGNRHVVATVGPERLQLLPLSGPYAIFQINKKTCIYLGKDPVWRQSISTYGFIASSCQSFGIRTVLWCWVWSCLAEIHTWWVGRLVTFRSKSRSRSVNFRSST